MYRVWQGNCYSKPAFIFLLASVLFTSTTGMAQEEEPGFLDRLFGSGKEASVPRADAANIAWKAELPPGLYDGDYSTCVAVAGSQRLNVESAVIVHFDRPAKITGAAVYVSRLSEEGDVSGEFLKEGFLWNSSLGKVSQLGTNATARVSPGSATTTSDLKFEITEISGGEPKPLLPLSGNTKRLTWLKTLPVAGSEVTTVASAFGRQRVANRANVRLGRFS
jgi:hypothetical protein